MSLSRCRRSLRPAIAGAAALLCLAMLGAQTTAVADTASELQEAVAEVAQLQETAEAAFQRQREAQDVLSELTEQLSKVQAAEQSKALQVEQSRRAVGRVARASYSTIGVDETLMLLLSDGSQDAARGLNDLKRVTDAALVDLDDQRRMEQELASARTSVAAQEAIAARARQEARTAAEQAQQALNLAQRREDELRQRYAAELQALRAEQAAQAERELHAARAAQASQSPPAAPDPQSGARAPSSGTPPSAASPAPASGSQRSTIVAWALSKVGARYVYGGDGPDAFDCSGFVSAAYAAAGISVPSYTGAQIRLVQQIPLQQARPGDMLFFFGRGAEHVAIALGDGRMVHAANPSSGVLVSNVNDPWYGERFTTAGRLLAD